MTASAALDRLLGDLGDEALRDARAGAVAAPVGPLQLDPEMVPPEGGEQVRPGVGEGIEPGPAVQRPLRVGLEALVADLESVDAVEEELRPLRELIAELARVAALAGSAGVELERVRVRALAVLRAFAAPGGPDDRGGETPRRPWGQQGRGRDPGFWKR